MLSPPPRELPFPAERLSTLAALEHSHFWFVPRREMLLRHLDALFAAGDRVVEIGAGTGALLSILAARGLRCVAVDQHPPRGGLDPAIEWHVADARALPLPSGSCDGVLMLDLLEHVDDEAALAEARRVLRPGGKLLVAVPALPLLWSYRDEAAGHLRRYTRATLRRVLAAAGFRVTRLHGYQAALLPLIVASRLLGGDRAGRDREDHPPPLLNWALTWLNRLDARVAAALALPIGSSWIAIAEAR